MESCTSHLLCTTHSNLVRVTLATLVQGLGHSYHSTQFTEEEVTVLWRQSSRRYLLAAKVYEETLGCSLPLAAANEENFWRQLTKKVSGGNLAALQYSTCTLAALQYSTCYSRTLLTFFKLLLTSLLTTSPIAHCIV